MTKLPTFLLVGTLEYRVTQDAEEWTERGTTGIVQATTYGATNHHKLLILLNPAQAPTHKADTLLHEALHCIWDISALPRKFDDHEQDHEETAVGHLTPWLLVLLRDNPKLLKYMKNPE